MRCGKLPSQLSNSPTKRKSPLPVLQLPAQVSYFFLDLPFGFEFSKSFTKSPSMS